MLIRHRVHAGSAVGARAVLPWAIERQLLVAVLRLADRDLGCCIPAVPKSPTCLELLPHAVKDHSLELDAAFDIDLADAVEACIGERVPTQHDARILGDLAVVRHQQRVSRRAVRPISRPLPEIINSIHVQSQFFLTPFPPYSDNSE